MKTYEPILYDNLFLSESHSRFVCAYSDSKDTSRKYNAISYGIADRYDNTNDNFEIIVDDFLSHEEFQEAKYNYWQGYMLCDICTQRQQEVLYILIVENIPRNKIAEKLGINKKNITEHIKSISKKYEKLCNRKTKKRRVTTETKKLMKESALKRWRKEKNNGDIFKK